MGKKSILGPFGEISELIINLIRRRSANCGLTIYVLDLPANHKAGDVLVTLSISKCNHHFIKILSSRTIHSPHYSRM